MRITQIQANFLKQNILACLPSAKIYLFGSRADDQRKGGDIDILIIAPRQLHFKEKMHIQYAFEKRFGERKLDLVSFTEASDDPFKALVLDEAILL